MSSSNQAASAETVLLRPSILQRLTGLLVPAAALLVLALTAVFLITAENPTEDYTRAGIWRIVCCAVIAAISLWFSYTKRITYILTPFKVMQKDGWELLYEDIASVTVKKSFFGSRVELVPRGAPDVAFFISAYDSNLPPDKVAGLIKTGCEKHSKKQS